MTVRWDVVEIVCDGAADDRSCPNKRLARGYGPLDEIRQRVARDGWVTGLRRGRDRCPDCAALARNLSAVR